MPFNDETVSNENLADSAADAAAPKAEKKGSKRADPAAALAKEEAKAARAAERAEAKAKREAERASKPRKERTRTEGQWDPVDGPYPVTRGKILTARIVVLNTEHGKKGKMGQFLNTILASETAMEALGVPAVVKHGTEEVSEFMDAGYITWAERNGFIKLEVPEAEAVAESAEVVKPKRSKKAKAEEQAAA